MFLDYIIIYFNVFQKENILDLVSVLAFRIMVSI